MTRELGPAWQGCQVCASPLVVDYQDVDSPGMGGDLSTKLKAMRQALLPVHPGLPIELGQGATPLIPAPTLGADVWLKLESLNPTGSHKDRFHSLAAPIARELGYRAAVTTSTGNHGAAAAAYLGRVEVASLVLLAPQAPRALQVQIAAHGAETAVLPDRAREIVISLVDSGWYPSTGADPALSGRGNPYGQEGYKAIAYEIVLALGRSPAVVSLPAASGDTLYGIIRGFEEMHERLEFEMPFVVACQPEAAAPLVATARGGYGKPSVVHRSPSIAVSASDPRSGWHASIALRDRGVAVEVSEAALLAALRRLFAYGMYIEPTAALALAGLEQTEERFDSGPRVAVLTSSGQNWSADIASALETRPPARDEGELMERLSARGLVVDEHIARGEA